MIRDRFEPPTTATGKGFIIHGPGKTIAHRPKLVACEWQMVGCRKIEVLEGPYIVHCGMGSLHSAERCGPCSRIGIRGVGRLFIVDRGRLAKRVSAAQQGKTLPLERRHWVDQRKITFWHRIQALAAIIVGLVISFAAAAVSANMHSGQAIGIMMTVVGTIMVAIVLAGIKDKAEGVSEEAHARYRRQITNPHSLPPPIPACPRPACPRLPQDPMPASRLP